MKILSGTLGGRSFLQPPTSTVRPLSEKVRGAIFDVLGDISGLTLLDAYAGSGAAGFEAASRGAVMVEAIEINAKVSQIIEFNRKSLELDWGYQLHTMTVATWLASPNQTMSPSLFDIIIADPPYVELDGDILERLATHLKPGGILVVSHATKVTLPVLTKTSLVKSKNYSDTTLSFYRKN